MANVLFQLDLSVSRQERSVAVWKSARSQSHPKQRNLATEKLDQCKTSARPRSLEGHALVKTMQREQGLAREANNLSQDRFRPPMAQELWFAALQFEALALCA